MDEHILHPVERKVVEMIPGSSDENQQDNYVPKLISLQLGIDNHVVWNNVDDIAHTVTPTHRHEDSYSGEFGSGGVVMYGESYEFLFTEEAHIEYYCEPHPWMRGGC